MTNIERYLGEIKEFKANMVNEIGALMETYFKQLEEEYKEENPDEEGYDYWNEEFGLEVDEAVKDFVVYMAVRLGVTIDF